MGRTLLEAEPAKVFSRRLQAFGLHLVHGQKDRLAAAQQQPRQLHVGAGELGAAVYDHDDGCSFRQRDLGLAEDLAGDQRLVIRYHAAGIDQPRAPSLPLDLTVDAVARDAGSSPRWSGASP